MSRPLSTSEFHVRTAWRRRTSAPAFPWSKRVFDIAGVALLTPVWLPLGAVTAVLILALEGRPLFYRATRAAQGGVTFRALKFRTMRSAEAADEVGVSGGHKMFRISRFCAFLRRSRLDEVPQLWNVICGEMSLVGPRPPDPRYVARFPAIYGAVLASRPGITGLATLHMHGFEDRVLRKCRTAAETEATYCRRCIPRKARLDLIYQARQARPGALWFDVQIILRSIGKIVLK